MSVLVLDDVKKLSVFTAYTTSSPTYSTADVVIFYFILTNIGNDLPLPWIQHVSKSNA